MSSSLANALKRKTHKERSQPASRSKYGLLEKRKDYLTRARDFHKKEAVIKNLKRKAEERNPDEFYFAMEKQRTKGGVHDGRQAQRQYSHAELQLMKTQDIKYVELKANVEAKRIKRMKESLHAIGAGQPSQHVVFVDSAEEAVAFQPEQYFDTHPDLLGRTFNRPRRAQLAATNATSAGPNAADALRKIDKRKAGAYNAVLQRDERLQQLSQVAGAMAYEKVVMGKGRKRKIKAAAGGEPAKYRWKRERKR